MNKKLNRILCLLISAAVILSLTPMVFADDTENGGIDSEIIEMYSIGVIPDAPDDDFRADDLITRGEFAQWLACAGMLSASSSEQRFSDVAVDSIYFSSIEALAENGVVDGTGGGIFRPDSDMTIAEAVKCAIGLLDFKEAAERYGGYPDGYLSLASDARLLRGVDITDGGYITRGSAAILIYNMMFTNVYER